MAPAELPYNPCSRMHYSDQYGQRAQRGITRVVYGTDPHTLLIQYTAVEKKKKLLGLFCVAASESKSRVITEFPPATTFSEQTTRN